MFLSKTLYLMFCFELVQSRKTGTSPDITENCFLGSKAPNQTKIKRFKICSSMALYDKAPIVAQHCTYFILLVQCNVYVYPEDLLNFAHTMLAVAFVICW